jgi:hypothetical protein
VKSFSVLMESAKPVRHWDGTDRKATRTLVVEAKDKKEARLRAEENAREIRAQQLYEGTEDELVPTYKVKEVRAS